MKKSMKAIALASLVGFGCGNDKEMKKHETMQAKDANGFTYEYVSNDPMGVRIYTLENGLKVYMAVNTDAPRIQTLIAVRAGSRNDPAETTGLAHYLEHMVFKGTDKIGAMNWEEEKVLLQEISDLYEVHKDENDPAKKKAIYAKIDSVSNEAAKLAIANEYDKMVSSIGAKYTNAFTSNDQTVYINDVPSDELNKWITLEAERFGSLVLRLFHTELETVYEEFNMGQDNDRRKVYQALMTNLFPNHPYGTQTTIGEGEHLKNPSMVNIQKFWETYYRPNNMAICLSGDFDMESVIKEINEKWKHLEPNPDIPVMENPKQPEIKEPIRLELLGPDAENLGMAFRFDGAASNDRLYMMLLSTLLSNQQAGLMDINLMQKQKVLSVYSYPSFMVDYSMFNFGARPKNGQSLEEVEALILEQIEKVKTGDFPDWLIEASVNHLRLNEITRLESNYRAYSFMQSFVNNTPWEEEVALLDKIDEISKEDLMAFANKRFSNNYVVTYKREGIDTTVMKVDKPQITPVVVNREAQSEFLKDFENIPSQRLEPVYLDFKSQIEKKSIIDGVDFFRIANNTNELFRMDIIFDIGNVHDRMFTLALDYLPYLGTAELSAEEIMQEFFKLGVSFNAYTDNRRSYLSLSGLDRNLDKALKIVSDLLDNAIANPEAYNELISDKLKERQNQKLNKGMIGSRLRNYATFGKESVYTDVIPEEMLEDLDPQKLVVVINEVKKYPHLSFYYGQRNLDEASELFQSNFKLPEMRNELPMAKEYKEQNTGGGQVLFVHHEMVQTDVNLLSKIGPYNPETEPMASLFNSFYGSGLSSIIFQEIREAKGLAYSAYSRFMNPSLKENSHYLLAFLGTQSDKMADGLAAMYDIMNNMPEAEKQFNSSKESILKKIESDRIIKDRIFWTYLSAKDKGLDYDIRQKVYNEVKNASIDDMKAFFETTIKNRDYSLLVVGNKKDVDFNVLKKYGTITELTKEEIFGY